MKIQTNHVLTALIVIFLGTQTRSEEKVPGVGFITIKNRSQADLVTKIIDHAYTRVDNRFLVSFDAHQQELLTSAGIEYEIVLESADPASTYIVRHLCHPSPRPVDMSSLGKTVDIGLGMQLVRMSRIVASTLAENTGLVATPLDQMQIRFHYLPPAIVNQLTGIIDFPTDSLVNLVSQDSIYVFNKRLEDFQTRYIWTDSIDRARDWIAQKFRDWGYTDVTTPEFWWNGDWHYNVMAVKPGYAEPDKVIVIGGHYDSIVYGQTPGPMEFAPGADDNGSGTTTVMELARVLADVPLRKTIIFIAFSAEEVGLVGSRAAAQKFMNDGTDIEVMYNFDMVGYTKDEYDSILVTSGPNQAYRDVTAAAATRLTSLIPIIRISPGNSDHSSFREQGYNVVFTIEADFNSVNYHSNSDSTSKLDFPYFTEVVKMAVASVAIVADAAHPTSIEKIVDIGDGQSLEIFWSDCDSSYKYTLYYGNSSGSYTDSVAVPQGQCSYIVSGLTEGESYYFSVIGEAPEGYPAIYSVEDSEIPLSVPRPPMSLIAEPDTNRIVLNWDDNREADLSHYRLYRQYEGLNWILYKDNIESSSFIDTAVVGQVNHVYKVTAVDDDGNESDFSNMAEAYVPTFDGGILVVDDIAQEGGMPSQADQEAFFDTIFGQTPFGLYRVEDFSAVLRRSIAGRYSSIFWIDDDFSVKIIDKSQETLAWYAGFTGNLFVCGYETIRFWDSSPLSPGEFLYDEFGLQSYEFSNDFDFAGAVGQDGWPSVEVDPNNIFGGNIPEIPKLTPRPGATVIYTYDSFSDDPAFEGQPCGLLYTRPGGLRILLAFPLYHLNHSSVVNLISYAKTHFGESAVVVQNGDVDGSGIVDFVDLVFLIDFLFKGGPAPLNLNRADVDASCLVNIADAVYLVKYLFSDGPEPHEGCVQP
ncbi:MAG: M20/M25/M40 family metallo-hydrolase [Candidatus Zixiibacteriota bacterium]